MPTVLPFVASDAIRAAFSAAMSAMYRNEVPAYGTLMELVADINAATLDKQPDLRASPRLPRRWTAICDERARRHPPRHRGRACHDAPRVRVMGMFPVGYYDISEAGVPVHSTAFRPVGEEALKVNPFRVFTSLLRPRPPSPIPNCVPPRGKSRPGAAFSPTVRSRWWRRPSVTRAFARRRRALRGRGAEHLPLA